MTSKCKALTADMLRAFNDEINTQQGKYNNAQAITPVGKLIPCRLTSALTGNLTETTENIAQVRDALAHLSPDSQRGNGNLYKLDGNFREDYWLLAIWALGSLDWGCGKQLAYEWSFPSERFTPEGFEDAWGAYDPSRENSVRIGSLFKLAMHYGWQNRSPVVLQAANQSRYSPLSTTEVRALPPQEWCIKDVMPKRGLAAIFGESGSGKSFLTLHMAAAIVTGSDWFGRRAHPTPVTYVMLEGEGGLRNRITALEQVQGALPQDTFKCIIQPFQLTSTEDVQELAAVVPHGGVLFIDTLNRAAPTSDENSSKEMGQILQAAKLLQSLIDGLVVVIHHTGKDPSRGMRGHSSLHAALDSAVEVVRNNNGRAWVLRKAKEGEEGVPTPFKLDRRVLGTDADGDEISSCTVSPDTATIFARPEPSGQKQKAAFRAIKGALLTTASVTTSITNHPSMKVEDAITLIAGTLTSTQANKRNNEARRLVTALISGSYLSSQVDKAEEAWCWLS